MRRAPFAAGILAVLVCTAVPASAQYRLERRLDLLPGGRLIVDTDGGSVTVVGDDSAAGRVGVFARYGNFRVSTESTPNEARIRVRRRDTWLEWLLLELWPRDRSTQIRVRVPRMTYVWIRTGGGPIHATRLAGPMELNTAGGSVRVDDVDGALNIRTGGGPINAWNIRGNVTAQTAGGRIDIADVRGAVTVHTGGGPILINRAAGRISARTSGGGVLITAAQDAVDAHSGGGPVRINGAAGRISARTSGGEVNIVAAGDRVDASSGGGPVRVAFARGNRAGGDLLSAGGRVLAAIDPSVPLTIDASSGGGSVASYIPVTTRSAFHRGLLSGDVNGGGALLRLRSSGGPVEIAAIR